MIDGKVLITTLLGLIFASATFCHFSKKKKDTHEGWWGGNPSRTWKVDRMIAKDHSAALKGDFVSIPNFQATLEPRFANTDFGASILYNPPSMEHMAAPATPLTFGNMASNEGFNGGCGSSAGCGRGGTQPPMNLGAPFTEPDYAAGNYNQMLDAAYSSPHTNRATDSTIPVGDMTVIDAMGQNVQPIVYDRYIYANRNSRLRALGDPIRGDLPIVPCASEWFRPSVHPHIDLQQGAMNVVGGWDNSTAQATAALIYSSSGNADVSIGGIDASTQLVGSTGKDGMVQISSFA